MQILVTERQLSQLYLSVLNESLKSKGAVDVKTSIKYMRDIPPELKEFATNNVKTYSEARKGKVTGLELHSDLKKKIREKHLPNGFDMGVDKNGYFIHTHRARSKSHEKPDGITVREIKFVDSTG